MRLLLNELPIEEDSLFIFLGDYVDRGPDSKGVIDTILELKKTHEVISLMGNHEEMFLDFLNDKKSPGGTMFLMNGGGPTLKSYDAEKNGKYKIPKEHIKFLKELEITYQNDDYFFVHAGIPDVAISELDYEKHREHFLWIRDPFLNNSRKWEKKIVHGHTPTGKVENLENRINLDTGCVFKNYLTALQLPLEKFYYVKRQKEEYKVDLKDPTMRRRAERFQGEVPVRIYAGESLHQFVTADFSELGMLLRDIIHDEKIIFTDNQIITGEVGLKGKRTQSFEAKVIRSFKNEKGIHYALEFTKDLIL